MRVYTARHVLPVARPPIENGAVAVENGRIAAVGSRQDVERAAPGAASTELGDAVLLPGLVNAHVHVELSWMAEDPPPGGDFARWVAGLIERREREDPARARAAAERAIESMVARGTVAAGDVGNATWVVPLLARSPLLGVAFHEIYGFRAQEAEALLAHAVGRLESLARDPDVAATGTRWSVVPTPHAPHTTSEPLLRALAGRSAAAGSPLTIHAAESREESELLARGQGALADLLRARGQWDAAWVPPGRSPIEHLDRLGVLGERTLAVHCVQLSGTDAARLQSRGASVVTCPRSNRYLGLDPAPIPRLLALGIRVALGTDSLASAPDLDLFAEMAALREEHAALSPAAVLRMATLNGATALGLADRLGSLAEGKLARLVVVGLPGPGDDPLETLTSRPSDVRPLDATGGEAA
jgi:cytosine/adenosine deaminase-related metal-dependent hydrolase